MTTETATQAVGIRSTLRLGFLAIAALVAGASLMGGIAAANAKPYQATAHAQCPTAANCVVQFARVPAGTRLDVHYVGCVLASKSGLAVSNSRMYLSTQQDGKTIGFPLANPLYTAEADGTYVHSSINEAIQFSVQPQQILKVFTWPGSGEYVDRIDCTIAGDTNDAVTTAPYQVGGEAKCPNGNNCVIAFPAIPQGKRLDAHYAACELRSANYGSTATSFLYLQTQQNGRKITLPLVQDQAGESYYDGTNNRYTSLSQPVAFSVSGGQQLKIFAWPSTISGYTYTIDQIDCTVTGDLSDASTAAPYQATASAKCPNGANCVASFPKLASDLHVKFASCEFTGSGGADYDYLQTQQNGKAISAFLTRPPNGERGRYIDNFTSQVTESQPIDFTVPAGQPLKVFDWPSAGTAVNEMTCTVNGDLAGS